MEINHISVEDLVVPDWHATYILRPDMVTLAASIGTYGILSPLIVRKDTNQIIDGVQRSKIVLGNKSIRKSTQAVVPVHFVDCDEIDAMILHMQINRGRGSMVAKKTSMIIKKLKRSKRLNDSDFDRLFCMKMDELDLMLDGTIIKQRDIPNYNYSRAWVPVEAPPNTTESAGISIERPPNQDR